MNKKKSKKSTKKAPKIKSVGASVLVKSPTMKEIIKSIINKVIVFASKIRI